MKAKNKEVPHTKVLVVCLGNICRSPAAQGILEDNIQLRGLDVSVDSAGTAAYHVGNQPDSRSISVLGSRDINIRSQRARQVEQGDFDLYDWVLVMDSSNLSDLHAVCPSSLKYKVRLFSSFDQVNTNEDVKDPYYGADDGFSNMADHLAVLSQCFLDYLESNS